MTPHLHIRRLRIILPAACLTYIMACRLFPAVGEGYARCVYPFVSHILSAFASVFPFSLEEVLLLACLIALAVCPVRARRKGRSRKHILVRTAEGGLWLIIWFYLGWGCNYYRANFFARTQSAPQAYDEAAFRGFLAQYTDSLNTLYTPSSASVPERFADTIRARFAALPASYGLCRPKGWQRPKHLLLNQLYSGVGVLGYMGPFFCEMQLNRDLLPRQYAFTYAHEQSHLLGVSNEAEANFWAYYICTRAKEEELRACGYFCILPYVAANARRLLPESDYRAWLASLRPEILTELEQQRLYWQSRYNPFIGSIQDYVYNLYLKGNRIPTGQQNYAEVVALILAFEKRTPREAR